MTVQTRLGGQRGRRRPASCGGGSVLLERDGREASVDATRAPQLLVRGSVRVWREIRALVQTWLQPARAARALFWACWPRRGGLLRVAHLDRGRPSCSWTCRSPCRQACRSRTHGRHPAPVAAVARRRSSPSQRPPATTAAAQGSPGAPISLTDAPPLPLDHPAHRCVTPPLRLRSQKW